ncbi:hypothetical protein IAD21_00537 [Abditibacteriota bacterium]|nr:hypothetical protein IAD21_00537 [Abditibacteriota bacterium]
MIQCRKCFTRLSCVCHFEPTSFVGQRLSTGDRSAICKQCYGKAQGKTPAQIDDELKELAFERELETSHL